MKKILTTAAAAALAATLLTACGGQQAASTVPESSAQNSQSLNTESIQDTDNKKSEESISEKTWQSTADDIRFNIDFRKAPQTSCGVGYIENIDNVPLAIGVANSATKILYGFDPLEYSDVTQMPNLLAQAFVDSLGRAERNGDYTGVELNRQVVLSKVENVGTENGYDLCRFEGSYQFTGYVDNQEYSFPVVGYTVLLKQSGYPVYVIAADMSDDQANAKNLDKIAHDCIASLRETA